MNNQEPPDCHHEGGHAWVSGRAELTDGGQVRVVSRQCRRCGYEQELPEE